MNSRLRTVLLHVGAGWLSVGVVHFSTRSGNLIFGLLIVGLFLMLLTGFTGGVATNQSTGLVAGITRTHGGDDSSELHRLSSYIELLPVGTARSFLFLYGAGMVTAGLLVLGLMTIVPP